MATRLAPAPSGPDLRPPLTQSDRSVPRAAARARALLPALILAAAALCASALVWSRADYVPMWDGRIYADCIIDAATGPFHVEAYRCGNHVSHAYVAILSLAQKIAPFSPLPTLLANAVLFALAVVALWRISARLLPDASHATARALTASAFLVHPVVLAALVQPGLDFGVLIFSLWLIAAVIDGRVAVAAVAGSLLVFSKEPGLLVYAVVATCYAWRVALPERARWPLARTGLMAAGSFLVAYNVAPDHPAILPAAALGGVAVLVLARPKGSVGRSEIAAAARRLRSLWPLVVPAVLFASYAAYRILSHTLVSAAASAAARPGARTSVLWGSDSARLLADMFFGLEMDPFERSALALVFVVGFLWIPTAIIALDALVGVVRAAQRKPARALPGANRDLVAFVLVLTAVIAWLLTRYETFSNARYYLPAYPLLLIAACCALVRLGVPRRAREATIALVAVLLTISTTRTIDPVSRHLWGTFGFGERQLLRVTAITRECCGYGRDQLAYNLEFTALAEAQDALYARLRPTNRTALVTHDYANLYTVGPIDARTHQRTLRRAGVVEPPIAPASQLIYTPIRIADGWTAWFVAFPNMDNAEPLTALARRYDIGPPVWGATPSGYAIAAYPIRSR
jgi:hypothetical protein